MCDINVREGRRKLILCGCGGYIMIGIKLEDVKIVVFGKATIWESVPQISRFSEEDFYVEHLSHQWNT